MRKFIFYTFIIIYLVLFVFTMRLHTFHIFPDKDTGVFLFIGELITENKVPYRDSWDHKPPLIYFLNSFLFNFFPKESITIAIFECFWIIISVIIIYLFTKHIRDEKVAFLTSTLFALYFSNISFPECYGLTETYQVLPAILSIFFIYLCIKSNSLFYIFLSGIFTAISFLFKQTGISVIIPAVFYILISNFIIKSNKIKGFTI